MSSPLQVHLLNGPNLGRLGLREPDVYGSTTLAELEAACAAEAERLGVELTCRQTDAEGEMIGWVHRAVDAGAAVVINPAGWTHTSVALRDACAQLGGPLVEVHLSNVHAREPWRAHSYISPIATAVITGMGPEGYLAALRFVAQR